MIANNSWQIFIEKGYCDKGIQWLDRDDYWLFYHYIPEQKAINKRVGKKIYTLDGDFRITKLDRKNRVMHVVPTPVKTFQRKVYFV